MADGGEIVRVTEAVEATALTPMQLLSTALERGAGVETLEKLMDLQNRWEDREARKAFEVAMTAAKAEIPTIKKNRHVGFASKNGGASTDYRHEDFAEIARTVAPILAKHGLSYRYRTASPTDGPVEVTCIISHRLGYSEENTLQAGRDSTGNKNSIQAIGSTVTYLQRYTLKAALGLAAENDDDGEAAEDPPITDEQRAQLAAKIDETGADIEKFCEHMRIGALVDLPQSAFLAAMKALEVRARQKKAQGAKP